MPSEPTALFIVWTRVRPEWSLGQSHVLHQKKTFGLLSSQVDMIMDQSNKEDNESMDDPADGGALPISEGPMTRARSKQLKEAIGGLLKTSLKQEEKLLTGLVFLLSQVPWQEIKKENSARKKSFFLKNSQPVWIKPAKIN
ncbi:hypothetical protein F2Q69_00012706 [Brassica cretica]|uniref:Uncharacterized protein n=1 Tax=Brassica cretica TaxID=69181 RepID=A0A8S9R5U6_BRACR|nr:hypothetical protein F2Q69_00012706 [Brassica cretica]